MAGIEKDSRVPPLRVLTGNQDLPERHPRPDVVRLYDEAYAELCRFLEQKLGDRRDAEDVAHDAFERLCRLCRSDHIEDLRGYLFTTAHRLALNHLRHKKVVTRHRASEFEIGTVKREASPERVVDGRDRLDRAWQAIARLPDKTCHVFLLHRFAGFTYPEVAKHVGLSRKSVEYHMKRALTAIATAVNASTDELE